MKSAIMTAGSKLFFFALCLLSGVYAMAQDGAVSSQTNETVSRTSTSTAPDTSWMSNPVVWVVGGVVLLIIIIAMVSGRRNGSRSEVTRSTTVTTEVKAD